MKHKAILVEKNSDEQITVSYKEINQEKFPKNQVMLKVDYSSLNYKDCLAVTKPASVLKNYPMIPGIDLAGTVIESKSNLYEKGDKVFINGWGIGEKFWGGFSEYASVDPDHLSLIPKHFTTFDVMAIGTAGYTSMLCIMALKKNGILPGSSKILVTGASGGVSSIAILLLNKMGYHVIASTGQSNVNQTLLNLGAKEIISRNELDKKVKPLEKQRWDGVIDVVGGDTLASSLAFTKYGGVVASTGLAGSIKLPTTVAPFIFRGVTLAGVDSVYCPQKTRNIAWKELEKYIRNEDLKKITKTIEIDQINEIAKDMLEGKILGRIVIDVNKK